MPCYAVCGATGLKLHPGPRNHAPIFCYLGYDMILMFQLYSSTDAFSCLHFVAFSYCLHHQPDARRTWLWLQSDMVKQFQNQPVVWKFHVTPGNFIPRIVLLYLESIYHLCLDRFKLSDLNSISSAEARD
jgi:hypothetical protein